MYRREFLAAGTAVTGGALAGCGSIESRSVSVPTVVPERPDGIYVPGHVEGMGLVGTATAGEYGLAVTYSYPHRFWTVTLGDAERTSIGDDDSVHLMVTVWHRDSGVIVPDVDVSVEITRDRTLRSQETVYAMLSQTMGLHYGANFGGLTDGETYAIDVTVGAATMQRTGAFRDRFAEPGSATVEFTFDENAMRDLRLERLDRAGERGALDPMAMDAIPSSAAPAVERLPGVTTETTAGDVRYAVTVLPSAPAGIDGGPYLAVSPRTRYNRFPLSRMGLSVTLDRDGEAVAEAELRPTLDPDLGYHYGTTLSAIESGGDLTVDVGTPPQVARHEGYETAFFDVPTATVSV